MTQDFEKIIQAAQSGGEILKKYFGEELKIEQKTTAADFRTKVDKESEETILNILSKYFPDYNIFAEESGKKDNGSEYTFVIDPLDGTNNFVLGIPYFSVTIALLKNDETIFAVIHNPITGQTCWAEKGKGAFLQGKKIKVGVEKNITKSSVVYSCSYALSNSEQTGNIIKNLKCVKKVKRVLTNWCPTFDYCLLAFGKIESIINDDNEIYDYIAGKLIAKEAGAVVTDFKGREQKDKDSVFVASNNEVIHKEVLEIVRV
ncbi:MAG: inositol monophosphatase [bacterium]